MIIEGMALYLFVGIILWFLINVIELVHPHSKLHRWWLRLLVIAWPFVLVHYTARFVELMRRS